MKSILMCFAFNNILCISVKVVLPLNEVNGYVADSHYEKVIFHIQAEPHLAIYFLFSKKLDYHDPPSTLVIFEISILFFFVF